MEVKVKKVHPNAEIPQYAYPGEDVGMDVKSVSVVYDKEYDYWEYDTGLAFEVPTGYGMFIFPRSSNRKVSAFLCNSVGILDSNYRGTLKICYKNRDIQDNDQPYKVGERLAQIVILPYPQITFKETNILSDTTRGAGSFGSTGK